MLKNENKFQAGDVFTISLSHFLHDVYSSFLAPLLPLLIDKFSLSYSLAGLLSVFQRLPSLLNPFVGIIADKVPIRYFLIFAPAATAIFMSLLGSASTYLIVAILLFFSGMSASLFHVPAPVMIKRISGNRVGKGMSFFMFGGEIARSVGPFLILSAVSLWTLDGAYRVMPIGLGASVLLFFKFRKIEISQNFKKSKDNTEVKETLKNVFPLLITVAGISFFMSIIRSALTAFLPTYVAAGGHSIWEGGIALSIVQLAGAFGSFSSGTFSDKLGRRETLKIISIVSPILMLLFVYSSGWLAVPILILSGYFLFSSTPVLLAIINEYKSEHPSFVNGLFMTMNFISGAGSVMIIGVLSDWLGFETTYKISAFLGLLSLLFVLRLDKKAK